MKNKLEVNNHKIKIKSLRIIKRQNVILDEREKAIERNKNTKVFNETMIKEKKKKSNIRRPQSV